MCVCVYIYVYLSIRCRAIETANTLAATDSMPSTRLARLRDAAVYYFTTNDYSEAGKVLALAASPHAYARFQ